MPQAPEGAGETEGGMREFHVLNLGAGVQSTKLYLDFMEGRITEGCGGGMFGPVEHLTRSDKPVKLDCAIFADTQDEPQAVYKHLDWLDSLGGPVILRVTAGRLGDYLVRGKFCANGMRFAAIPAFTTADGGNVVGRTRRQCSKEYKTEPIERAIRQQVLGLRPRQHTPKDVVVHQYFGISLDEASRATRISEIFWGKRGYIAHFPLIELMQTRANILENLAGRVPHRVPRSACVYCPFHSDEEWQALKDRGGEDWARAVQVDAALRGSGSVANRDMNQVMYVHRSCLPLTQIEFRPKANRKEQQLGFGFECEGVCGV